METLRNLLKEEVGLTEDQVAQFAGKLKIVPLAKKDFLIRPGTTCMFIGFVAEGVLRSFVENGGEEFNVDFYLAHSFVSAYTSFLTQTPATGSIQALADTTVYLLSYPDYQHLLATDDSWYRFGKYLSDQLFIRKCKREASFLTDSARERLTLLLQQYPGIEQLVPQYHIASYLGIKPESLSRIKALTYIKAS